MPKSIKDLAHLKPSAHPGIGALFSKAHSHIRHIDRDVDWTVNIDKTDPCVEPSWAPFGRTPTFQRLSPEVKKSVARQALVRTLNILRVGEALGVDVCAKFVLLSDDDDFRSCAAAQSMDEARHHLAVARLLEKMGGEPAEIDPLIAKMFDEILASDDKTFLIASVQLLIENSSMALFERLHAHATHPLLRQVIGLIQRDESRHVAFGALYLTEYLKTAAPDARMAFGRRWLARILQILDDPYGPHVLKLATSWLRKAGADNPERAAERMWAEHQLIRQADLKEAADGRRVSHLLTAARRIGLLSPDILEALHLSRHPLILGALRARLET